MFALRSVLWCSLHFMMECCNKVLQLSVGRVPCLALLPRHLCWPLVRDFYRQLLVGATSRARPGRHPSTLQVCQRHIGDLSECGVRLSAAFTALSTLIRPPKSKKKKWWQFWKKAEKRKGKKGRKGGKGGKAAGGASSSANGLASGAADAAAATAAALEQEQQRRALSTAAAAAAADGEAAPDLAAQQQQHSQQAQHGGSDSDDPFAGLADGSPGGQGLYLGQDGSPGGQGL